MSLEPLDPETGVELYLADRETEVAKATLYSHSSRLGHFTRWCEEQEIDNLNELTGRLLHEYRLWRRNEGDLAPATEKTQMDTLRVFIKWAESVDAVERDLHTKVRSPVLRDGQNVRDVMLESDRAEEILEYLAKYEYASRQHVAVALMWHTMMRVGAIHSLDVEDYDPESQSLAVIHRPKTGTTMRPESGPGQVLGVMMAMTVEADGEEIVTNMLGEGEQRWVETEPYVYHSVDGHDVLAFDVEDGDVQRAHQSSVPMTTFKPTPIIDRQIVSGGGLGAAVLVFVLSTVGWTGWGAWRRIKRYQSDDGKGGGGPRDGADEVADVGQEDGDSDGVDSSDVQGHVSEEAKKWTQCPEHLSRGAGAGLCVASLALVGLLVGAFAAYEDLVFALDPVSLQLAFASAYLVALFTVGTVIGAVLAWKNTYWSLGARLHQTLLAIAGVVFVTLLVHLGLLL